MKKILLVSAVSLFSLASIACGEKGKNCKKDSKECGKKECAKTTKSCCSKSKSTAKL